MRARGTTKRGTLFRLSVLSKPLAAAFEPTSHSKKGNCELPSQCGIIASRRVGRAVIRNRVKRRLRTLYRQERMSLLPDLWLVIVATPQAATATLPELQAEWHKLGERLAIFQDRS